MLYAALTILALLYFCLLALSLQKVRNSGDKFEFMYAWGALFGAFVWEDLAIFSGFFLAVCMLTLFAHDLRVGLLFTVVFWIIRGAGETLYFFLQQFIQPQHSPHNIEHQLGPLQTLFGKICPQKCFILMQVTYQILCVAAVSCLILLVMHWRDVPAWIN